MTVNSTNCEKSGWRRAVFLNMTDPNTNCPSGWQLTGYSKRTCGRANSSRLSCDSVFFPVIGGSYSQVCGRIRPYQYGLPDAFLAYYDREQTTIDSAYVSGAAVMYGSPQQHLLMEHRRTRKHTETTTVHVILIVLYPSHHLLEKITSMSLDV